MGFSLKGLVNAAKGRREAPLCVYRTAVSPVPHFTELSIREQPSAALVITCVSVSVFFFISFRFYQLNINII